MPNDIFALAFEACPAAMLMVDSSGRIEVVNSQCEQIFGYPRGEMAGMNIDDLLPETLREAHLRQRRTYVAAPQKRLMGVGRDLRARRRDGLEFRVEIGLTPVTTARGLRILAFAIDITARLDSEARLKQSLDNLSRANQGLATFAYAASHDIQEPLRKICAFAEILDAALVSGDSQEMRYAAGVMVDSARRARGLVADLLSLSRSIESDLVFDTFSIRPLIGEAKEHCAQAVEDTRARIELLGDDFDVRGDRSLTLHILVNLLSNALKYGKPDQPPRVRFRLSSSGAEHLLTVEDDGVGFAQVHAETIFTPFHRLRGRGDASGHGIGLAICKTVANRHGWRIAARGRPDIGAEFEITFPRLKAPA